MPLLSGALAAKSARASRAASGPLPLAQVNVSKRAGAQFESAIAVAPSDPSLLLAGSNDLEHSRFDELAYTSTDGGTSWATSRPYTGSECAIADPATAIDADGRELFSYLVAPCRRDAAETTTSVYVSTRGGPAGAWTPVRVARPPAAGTNDKPTIAWDSFSASPYRGRAYVVWAQIRASAKVRSIPKANLLLAHSDSGGASWSKPVQIKSPTLLPSNLFPSLAVAPLGDLYLAWTNDAHAVFVARSSDGGTHFTPAATVQRDTFFANVCFGLKIGAAVPAQDRRCVTTTPTVVASATRVTVVYAAPGADARELDVFARGYDRLLRPLHQRVLVNPADDGAATDQFEPVAALDTKAALIWVCFYDTRGDRTRRTARFSCTASKDGIAWSRPLAVATVRSNEARPPATRFQYGDYQSLAVDSEGIAHPTWTDARQLIRRGEEIYTTVLTAANLGYRPRRQHSRRASTRLSAHGDEAAFSEGPN